MELRFGIDKTKTEHVMVLRGKTYIDFKGNCLTFAV